MNNITYILKDTENNVINEIEWDNDQECKYYWGYSMDKGYKAYKIIDNQEIEIEI